MDHLFIIILINDGWVDNLRPLNLTSVLFWFRNSTLSIDHHFFHEGFGGFDAFFCPTAFPGEPGRKLAMETSSSSVACPWLSLPTCADSWSSPYEKDFFSMAETFLTLHKSR